MGYGSQMMKQPFNTDSSSQPELQTATTSASGGGHCNQHNINTGESQTQLEDIKQTDTCEY